MTLYLEGYIKNHKSLQEIYKNKLPKSMIIDKAIILSAIRQGTPKYNKPFSALYGMSSLYRSLSEDFQADEDIAFAIVTADPWMLTQLRDTIQLTPFIVATAIERKPQLWNHISQSMQQNPMVRKAYFKGKKMVDPDSPEYDEQLEDMPEDLI